MKPIVNKFSKICPKTARLILMIVLASAGTIPSFAKRQPAKQTEEPKKEERKGYTKQASLNKVHYTGFHKIVLPPEVMGQLRSDKKDIRIFDSNNKQIPYLMDTETPVEYERMFKTYTITKKYFPDHGTSYIIFHNPKRDSIDNISLVVRNSDVKKYARLSGSHDGKKWFVIKNDYHLHSMYSNNTTTECRMLNFPLSNYEYFRIELDYRRSWFWDPYWHDLPIEVLNVGYYDYRIQRGKRMEYEPESISQMDTNKTSKIMIKFDNPAYFEQLKFDMDGAEYYLRSARLYMMDSVFENGVLKGFEERTLQNFSLNSNSRNEVEVDLYGQRPSYVFLEIQNNDDQPLTLKNVRASYLKHYLVANLKPEETYTLKFHDQKAEIPRYDLAYFKANIPEDIASVRIGSVSELVTDSTSDPAAGMEGDGKKTAKQDSVWADPYITWSVLILVGGVLAFVSIRMVLEMSKKEKETDHS